MKFINREEAARYRSTQDDGMPGDLLLVVLASGTVLVWAYIGALATVAS